MPPSRARTAPTQELRELLAGPPVRLVQRLRFMDQPAWLTLGFTDEDVFGAWQHGRLAQECARAFARRGVPPTELFESPGEGRYVLLWHLSPTTAQLLDSEGVTWRRFLVGERTAPPNLSHPVVPVL